MERVLRYLGTQYRYDIRKLEACLLIEATPVPQPDLDELLYDFMCEGWCDGVALLLLLGADAHRTLPAHDASTVFDLSFRHCHGRERPLYGYLRRLLETRPPEPGVPLYHDRVGRDVDAPLDGVGPRGEGGNEAQLARKETAVHFAVERDDVYALMWLVERRGARLDRVDVEGLKPIGRAMRRVEYGDPGTRDCARSSFLLMELLIRRYAQDPVPYAEAFPVAMAAVHAWAAHLLHGATRKRPRDDEYASLALCVGELDARGAFAP